MGVVRKAWHVLVDNSFCLAVIKHRSNVGVVRDGKILTIAPREAAEIPEDAVRIDGKGRWLMQGLTEMHGHVPGPGNPAFLQDMLFLHIANGVMTPEI